MKPIYLDYNATTSIAPSVQEAMLPFLAEYYGNPSSDHALGRACHEAIEDARGQVASLLGADRDEIFFTSGGTESNNLAIKGVVMRTVPAVDGHLVISAIEHPAVVEPARYLERLGFDLTVVPCNDQGVVDPENVERALRKDTRLVSVMLANNEIGTIQPIREMADACRAQGVLIHTDAAQAVGKIRTLVDELGVDMLSLAGHKFYAPKGVGALYVRRGTALEPIIHGAGHESGLRSGTENTPYIVGLGKAAVMVAKSIDDAVDRMALLRDRLLERLEDGVGGGVTVNGRMAPRLPNTLSVALPGVSGPDLLLETPEICASTGAACHSGGDDASLTLKAIGVPPDVARGTVRLSVGWYTSEEQIDRAAELLIAAWDNLH